VSRTNGMKPTDIKQSNTLNILQFVRRHGTTSKPEIAKSLGMSRPTVSLLVDELVEWGYLKNSGIGSSTIHGGKRPQLFDFNPDAGVVTALRIGINVFEAALLNFDAKFVCHLSVPIEEPENRDYLIRQIYLLMDQIMEKAREKKIKISGIGIGSIGVVETATGTVVLSYSLKGINNVPVGQLIEERYGLPVFIDNSSRVLALAEQLYGHASNVENFVLIETDDGIGTGIVMNGNIYRGLDDSIGEFGHTTIDWNGPLCRCGSRGCWEQFVAKRNFLSRVTQLVNQGADSYLRTKLEERQVLTINDIMMGCELNDPLTLKLMEEHGVYLGVGIANLVNMINPEIVLLHGEVAKLEKYLYPFLLKTTNERALPKPRKRVKILFSELGEEAYLIGAGSLVVNQFFANPENLLTHSINIS
jgi:N-acetylglucosamine repressor